ncbi:cytochrome P450 76C4-like [Papaver somniferum]|uniref:cytochrome P450 76C4-like n=1 Tax=Papaver somniferum TaxID=3469 RepID=UPI000E6F8BC1|nr:cytochrome P450 76C4-like [Papaver somniferum]
MTALRVLVQMISQLSAGFPWGRWVDDIADGENKVMGVYVSVVVVVLITCVYVVIVKSQRRNGRELRLPPGPRGLPLIGNLLSLEPNLHVYFEKLSKIYGLIIKLQFGMKCVIVVSSSSLAKEILRDQDVNFAGRDRPVALLALTYGWSDIIWGHSDQEWRKLRKICNQELLSNTSLDSCYALRRKEVRRMVKDVYGMINTPINVGEQVFVTILNVVLSMLWGATIHGEERINVGIEFQRIVTGMNELVLKPNISDFFPILARFDLQGFDKEANKLVREMDQIFHSVIDQHLKLDKENNEHREKSGKDFLQFLLELMEKQDSKTRITIIQLKALLLDVVAAGADTSITTVEWAMTEMMHNPEVIRRAQEELDQVIGIHNVVEESHMSKLHYLNAVVKETLRLHPGAPLLVPHCSIASSIVGGYTVPKGSRIFVSAWAIHRDPEAWIDPLRFQPERFLGSDDDPLKKYDYRGNNFDYIPFGSGRRVCVGINLAERMVIYVLASLLHSFDWKLPEGTKLDFKDTFGIVLRKTTPLSAIPTLRLSNLHLYEENMPC